MNELYYFLYIFDRILCFLSVTKGKEITGATTDLSENQYYNVIMKVLFFKAIIVQQKQCYL